MRSDHLKEGEMPEVGIQMTRIVPGDRKVVRCGIQDSAVTKIQAKGCAFRLTQATYTVGSWSEQTIELGPIAEMDHESICSGLYIPE